MFCNGWVSGVIFQGLSAHCKVPVTQIQYSVTTKGAQYYSYLYHVWNLIHSVHHPDNLRRTRRARPLDFGTRSFAHHYTTHCCVFDPHNNGFARCFCSDRQQLIFLDGIKNHIFGVILLTLKFEQTRTRPRIHHFDEGPGRVSQQSCVRVGSLDTFVKTLEGDALRVARFKL